MSQTKAELVNGLSVNAAADDAITVDSSGRILVGQTSSNNSTSMLQLKRANNNTIRLANSDATATNFVALDLCPANSLIGARIVATADGTFSSSSAEDGHLKFFTTADGTSSERIRVDSAGNLLVGTSSTSAMQKFGGSAAGFAVKAGQPVLAVEASANSQHVGYLGQAGTDTFLGGVGGGNLIFQTGTGGAERLRIDSSGKVGIGITSLVAKFSVSENANLVEPMRIDDTNNTNGNRHRISFRTGNSEVGKIVADRSSTTYITSSDYRLKENESIISDGITRLKSLKPYRFNFKINPEKIVDGFFAHEVGTVVPEAISGTKDEVDADNKPIYQGIDQSKLVPLLTAALQEEIAKRETLESRVATLEAA